MLADRFCHIESNGPMGYLRPNGRCWNILKLSLANSGRLRRIVQRRSKSGRRQVRREVAQLFNQADRRRSCTFPVLDNRLNFMTKKGETTSKSVGTKASGVLRSPSTGKASKSASGSALAQRQPGKVTSPAAGKAASKVLRDWRSSPASKSAAASTLTQRPNKRK